MSDSLEGRLARLERNLRLHRIAVVVVGLASITCGSGVTSNFGLVRTARLEIVDGDDKPRMSLTANAGGTVSFTDGEGTVVLDAATLRRLVRGADGASGEPQ